MRRREMVGAAGFTSNSSPVTVGPPTLYSGNAMPVTSGTALSMHTILNDAEKNLAISVGQVNLVTAAGREVLSRLQPEQQACR